MCGFLSSWLFVFHSVVFPGFCLVVDPKGGLGGLGAEVGSACEELEDKEGDTCILVNVSENSRADLPGLSQIKVKVRTLVIAPLT